MIFTVSLSSKYTSNDRTYTQNTISVVECTKNRYEKDYFYHSGQTENHMLFWVCSGRIRPRDETEWLQKNSLILVPKRSRFSCSTDENTTLLQIIFDYTEPLPFPVGKKLILNASYEIQEYLNKLYRIGLFQDTLTGLPESLLLLVIHEIHTMLHADLSNRKLFEETYEWIEQHAKQNISASDAADAMNKSVAHLNRVVRQHSQQSLSELIASRRIFEIKHLCSSKSITISEMADALDFASPELLRKYYRYHTGTSLKQLLDSQKQ